ncbi:MAG: hypothetical protein IMZ43_02700 [Thermoplasmata archaeon]|nr:hypothetical protein [Thermoplasmata archaeon]
MVKTPLKKSLVCGTVVLFISMGFIPMTGGLSNKKQAFIVDRVADSSMPNSEGLPDLIIEDIFIDLYYNGPGLPYPALFCRIRNIGDAPVSYIRYNVVVKQILLNIIPTRTITSENFTTSTHPGMPPGGTYIGVLPGGTDIFPLFGFFRFHVTMNPDRAVNESNYDNNYYAETFFEWHPPIFGYVRWYSLE